MTTLHIEPSLIAINYRSGRSSAYAIDLIVIHCAEGDRGSVVSWFNDPEAVASAHYLVCKDGTVLQFVHEENTAWHAGRVNAATAAIVLERAPWNPNGYSVGIEHEAQKGEALTPAQLAASLALIADIAARHGIPLDRRHIVGHHEIYSLKSCPNAISVDALVQTLNEPAATSTPEPPRVVWSNYIGDYLIVTQYVDDAHWSFLRASELAGMPGHPANALLSDMPAGPS